MHGEKLKICADILQNIENGPVFLENTITCDESWFFSIVPRKKVPIHALEEFQFTKSKKRHGRANLNLNE